ncbi:hypothetical protein K0017_08520 [Staphylococcus massiliensis]|uniref:helix-hairpin-helix domain-containing protein n=1 Tax=Staphylococcus massiliensis TaxID=555791 RepID=UPI001EDD02B6|nr:helix-hairpin-helix domain-containing protein [Staphylococcus massiliensis]MCG3402355.1 hypothetical protein [Staphylococcus massiliensis]
MGHALPKIGKPATQALHKAGIETLEAVAEHDEAALLDLHGVGPKAVRILKEALDEVNLSLKHQESDSNKDAPFEVVADLSCDNAPKARTIKAYLIASAACDKDKLDALLSDSLTWHVPGDLELSGKAAFIKALKDNKQDVKSLEITSILTHGKLASAHGVLTTSDATIYFASFFEFEGHKKDAKIQDITSYVI